MALTIAALTGHPSSRRCTRLPRGIVHALCILLSLPTALASWAPASHSSTDPCPGGLCGGSLLSKALAADTPRVSAQNYGRRLQQTQVDAESPLGLFEGVPPCEELEAILGPIQDPDEPLGNFTTRPFPSMLRRCVDSSALRLRGASDAVQALSQPLPLVKIMETDPAQALFEIPSFDLAPGSVNVIACGDRWLDGRKILTPPLVDATLMLIGCRALQGDTNFPVARRFWLIDSGVHFPCNATQALARTGGFPRSDPQISEDELINLPGVTIYSSNATLWCWEPSLLAEIENSAVDAEADAAQLDSGGDTSDDRVWVYVVAGIGSAFAAMCCCGSVALCWHCLHRRRERRPKVSSPGLTKPARSSDMPNFLSGVSLLDHSLDKRRETVSTSTNDEFFALKSFQQKPLRALHSGSSHYSGSTADPQPQRLPPEKKASGPSSPRFSEGRLGDSTMEAAALHSSGWRSTTSDSTLRDAGRDPKVAKPKLANAASFDRMANADARPPPRLPRLNPEMQQRP